MAIALQPRAVFVDSLLDSACFIIETLWPLADSVTHNSESNLFPSIQTIHDNYSILYNDTNFTTNIQDIQLTPTCSTNSHSTSNKGNISSLRAFVRETLRRSRTSYSTLQIALYYLLLLKPYTLFTSSKPSAVYSNMQLCGRRAFLAALILASKYLQDRNFSSHAWSKISGLSVKQINRNEMAFLTLVSWKIHVPLPVYHRWCSLLLYSSTNSSSCSSTSLNSLSYKKFFWKQILTSLTPKTLEYDLDFNNFTNATTSFLSITNYNNILATPPPQPVQSSLTLLPSSLSLPPILSPTDSLSPPALSSSSSSPITSNSTPPSLSCSPAACIPNSNLNINVNHNQPPTNYKDDPRLNFTLAPCFSPNIYHDAIHLNSQININQKQNLNKNINNNNNNSNRNIISQRLFTNVAPQKTPVYSSCICNICNSKIKIESQFSSGPSKSRKRSAETAAAMAVMSAALANDNYFNRHPNNYLASNDEKIYNIQNYNCNLKSYDNNNNNLNCYPQPWLTNTNQPVFSSLSSDDILGRKRIRTL